MNHSVLVVDDEDLARDRLCRLLEKHGQFAEIRTANDGASAVHEICRGNPDVVFLDIQMPFMNGFEVVEKVGAEAMPRVVFVTAYDQYALRAFDVNAVDYLLKPYTEQRFAETLRRVLAANAAEHSSAIRKVVDDVQATRRYVQRLVVRRKDELLILKVADIDYVEAANNYVKIFSGSATYILREGISSLESQLDPAQFARIHRSTIVNIDRIRSMKPWFSGDYIIVLSNGKQLRLSRTHRHKFSGITGADPA
jgi:two-component system LytT family response regulator